MPTYPLHPSPLLINFKSLNHSHNSQSLTWSRSSTKIHTCTYAREHTRTQLNTYAHCSNSVGWETGSECSDLAPTPPWEVNLVHRISAHAETSPLPTELGKTPSVHHTRTHRGAATLPQLCSCSRSSSCIRLMHAQKSALTSVSTYIGHPSTEPEPSLCQFVASQIQAHACSH